MRSLRILVAAAGAAALALVAPAAEEKTNLSGGGGEKVALLKADPTTAGSFDGTWMYVNRDARVALWARTKNGVPQVKLQYVSLASPEAFETDWDGKAEYYLAGSTATFELKLGKSSSDRIVGTWSWVLKIGTSGRRETADIVMYRTGYGRTLLLDFQNYEKTITRDGQDKTVKLPIAWGLLKISRRELLWDELPF
jgi:hypothetical protein